MSCDPPMNQKEIKASISFYKNKSLIISYSPALKKWGCIGFGLSFRHSVILLFRYSLFRNSVTISFPLNILRTNGQNLTKFCIHINIDKI